MTPWWDRWGRREVACPQCGAGAPSDATWCGDCGASLRRTAVDDDATDDGPRTAADGGRTGRLVAGGTVVAVLATLLAVQVAQDPVSEPAGETSRGDAARTGVVSTVPVPPPEGVAWRRDVALPPLASLGADVLGTTTTDDGRELVTVLDPAVAGQRVTSHAADTGEVVATTMLPLGAQPYDTSLDAGLLAHRDLTSVTLVDVATGERRWRVERRLREDTEMTRFGVVGVDVGGASLTVVLLDLGDGSERWTRQVVERGRVTRIAAVGETLVVQGDVEDGAFVTGLDPATGEEQWRLGPQDLPFDGPRAQQLVTDGRRLLLLTGGGALLVDPADGTTTTLPLPTGFVASVGGVAGDTVVLSDVTSRVVALDVATASPGVRWEAPAASPPVFSVALNDEVVAVRGDSGTVLLDTTTGTSVTVVAPAGGTPRLSLTADGAVPRLLPSGALELVGEDGPVWSEPSVAIHLPDLVTSDGAVAVTTPDGVQVHDVDDGTRRFAHEAFEPDLVTAGGLTAPALLGGRVAIAPPLDQPADRGGLLALFADTGIVDWAREDDRVVPRGTPVADRGLVLLPVGSQVLGFDRRNGARTLVVETAIARTDLAARGDWLAAVDAPRDSGDLWVGRRSDRSQVFRAPIRTCAPPLLFEDVVIVTDHLGDIVARELATGDQPWGEKALGSACRPLAMVGDVLVALVDDHELLGVATADGEPVWRVELPSVATGPPVVAGEQVLVPTLAGEVLAWDVGAAEPAWRVEVGGVPAGAVAVDGDTLLVQTRGGELVALR